MITIFLCVHFLWLVRSFVRSFESVSHESTSRSSMVEGLIGSDMGVEVVSGRVQFRFAGGAVQGAEAAVVGGPGDVGVPEEVGDALGVGPGDFGGGVCAEPGVVVGHGGEKQLGSAQVVSGELEEHGVPEHVEQHVPGAQQQLAGGRLLAVGRQQARFEGGLPAGQVTNRGEGDGVRNCF